MSDTHFAKVINGKVVNIILADQEFIDTIPAEEGVSWVQTCMKTNKGVHEDGGTPLRGNRAKIGDIYDAERDVFYKDTTQFTTWVYNEEMCRFRAPVDSPTNEPFWGWSDELYLETGDGWFDPRSE